MNIIGREILIVKFNCGSIEAVVVNFYEGKTLEECIKLRSEDIEGYYMAGLYHKLKNEEVQEPEIESHSCKGNFQKTVTDVSEKDFIDSLQKDVCFGYGDLLSKMMEEKKDFHEIEIDISEISYFEYKYIPSLEYGSVMFLNSTLSPDTEFTVTKRKLEGGRVLEEKKYETVLKDSVFYEVLKPYMKEDNEMKKMTKEQFVTKCMEAGGCENDSTDVWVNPFGIEGPQFHVTAEELSSHGINFFDIYDTDEEYLEHAFDISFAIEEDKHHVAWDYLYDEYELWFRSEEGC